VLGATSGPATPVAPNLRAALPTIRDISGHDLATGGTAMVPAQSPAEKFGTTTNLTSRPRRQKPLVITGIVALAAVSIAGAIYTYRLQTRIHEAEQANAAAIEAARSVPLPPVAARPAPPPTPAPAIAAPAPAVAPAPAGTPEPALAAKEPAPREHAKHHHATAPAAKAAGTPAAVATAPAVAAPAPPAPVAPAPPPRGAGEVLAEADKLLGQGEVAEACTRGEEAKRMSPRLPSVYKFLGKCYMRAGRAQQANDNYKKYLELAPNATDAPFVKSMIK